MTEQEAIRKEKDIDVKIVYNTYKEMYDNAKIMGGESTRIMIDKLPFKELGIIVEALEKQIPKKPPLVKRAGGIISFYPCPNCSTPEKYVSVYPKQKYCVYCGQRLDWSEEE